MRVVGVGAGAAVAVVLAACSTTAQSTGDIAVRETTSTTAAGASTTAPDPDSLAIGSRFTTEEGNTVQVHTFQQPVQGDVVGASAGREFAAIEAEVCAGRRSARVTPARFVLEMADGSRRARSYFGPKEPQFPEGPVMANQCVRGWVSFEVPEGQRASYVVFDGSSLGRWSTTQR